MTVLCLQKYIQFPVPYFFYGTILLVLRIFNKNDPEIAIKGTNTVRI